MTSPADPAHEMTAEDVVSCPVCSAIPARESLVGEELKASLWAD
jgi:hypothetical protein